MHQDADYEYMCLYAEYRDIWQQQITGTNKLLSWLEIDLITNEVKIEFRPDYEDLGVGA